MRCCVVHPIASAFNRIVGGIVGRIVGRIVGHIVGSLNRDAVNRNEGSYVLLCLLKPLERSLMRALRLAF